MTSLTLSIAPGYAFDNLPDLSSVAERERLSSATLQGFFAIMEKWRVDADSAAALLGGVPRGTFYKLKKCPATQTQDEYANAWMTHPNRDAMFGGHTPLAYAIHGGIPALARVRSLLDAAPDGK